MIDLDETYALAMWASPRTAIKAVWLFGSRAREDHRPDSDYDIALELEAKRGADDWAFTNYFFEHDAWKAEIRELLHSEVSLVGFREDLDCKFDPREELIWSRSWESDYVHFDEYEDAVLAIELAAEKFGTVQERPTEWKWIVLAMQNALQSAMVLALSGTDGCGALALDSQKTNRRWLENPTPNRPRQHMADFTTLLSWVQKEERLQGPPAAFSEKEKLDLSRLNILRRQFAHYNPTSWGIELKYLHDIVPAAIKLFEHLTTTQPRPMMNFTEGQKSRLRRAIAAISAEGQS